MRRADRLFQLIQVLRCATGPMTADMIGAELEVSRRTIYRDISTLVAQRVPIRGEAGIGYVLESGFDLPPLMLTTAEVEAVALGAQWVIGNADAGLAHAARDVLAKVAAILPGHLRPWIDDPVVATPSSNGRATVAVDLARVRLWCREGRKLTIRYVDGNDEASERTVWPFVVGYVADAQAVIAWCELRNDFRVFLTDRVASFTFLHDRYPERGEVLRRRWHKLVRDRKSDEDRKGRGTSDGA